MCSTPPVIDSASWEIYDNYFKDRVEYACAESMRTEDGQKSKTITCETDGRWSNENFTCAGKSSHFVTMPQKCTLS